MSGLPGDGSFNVFPSEVISPRAFQMKRGKDSWDLLRAVDAAVVRTQRQGQLLQAINNNPPFEVCNNPSIYIVLLHKKSL